MFPIQQCIYTRMWFLYSHSLLIIIKNNRNINTSHFRCEKCKTTPTPLTYVSSHIFREVYGMVSQWETPGSWEMLVSFASCDVFMMSLWNSLVWAVMKSLQMCRQANQNAMPRKRMLEKNGREGQGEGCKVSNENVEILAV